MTFPNLVGEMAKRGISSADLAKAINKTTGTFSAKLNGKYEFTLIEAFKVKQRLQTPLSIDDLFSKELRNDYSYSERR